MNNVIKPIIGVCLFDDKNSPGDGWACLSDAPPERVTGVHDLSSDVCWVTNLEYKAFMQHNLGNSNHICQAQYFRQSVDFLLSNYGFGNLDNKTGAAFLARHLNLTAWTGYQLLKVDPLKARNNYRYFQLLIDQIKVPVQMQPSRGLPEATSQFIIDNAVQHNQIMMASRPVKSVPMHCYFPSFTYFKWLLNQPVPISMDWNLVGEYADGRLFGYKNGKFERFESLDKIRKRSIKLNTLPFFRISVMSQNKEYATFGTFGAGKQGGRSWVTLPELLTLCRYSLVKVFEVYELPSGLLSDQVEILKDIQDIENLSVSHGLFLENLAAAFMAPMNKRETALGAYLRAYDRSACLVAAERLYNAGLHVGSFSMGKIVILAQESQRQEVQRTSSTIGLVPFL